MWINVNGPFPGGGSGSTEFLFAGIGTSGNRVEWTGSGSTADGVYFSADGDGGVSDTSTTMGDFCAYNGTVLIAPGTGAYRAGTFTGARGNNDPYYVTAFPGGAAAPALQQIHYSQQTGTLSPGTLGMAWHDVIIARRGTTVSCAIDGVAIAAISNVTWTAGNVFVGFWDPFASLSGDNAINFGLVDNVRVETAAIAPRITAQPSPAWVRMNSNVLFSVSATGLPSPGFQWRLNDTPIEGATNATLSVTNVQPESAGAYSVMVSNLAGFTVSSNALLSIIPTEPAQFQTIQAAPDGTWQLTASAQAGATYVLEISTNLADWSPFTNAAAFSGILHFSIPPGAGSDRRFFRARSGP